MNIESIEAAIKILREQQEYCIDHYDGPISFFGDTPEHLLVERSKPEVKTKTD